MMNARAMLNECMLVFSVDSWVPCAEVMDGGGGWRSEVSQSSPALGLSIHVFCNHSI